MFYLSCIFSDDFSTKIPCHSCDQIKTLFEIERLEWIWRKTNGKEKNEEYEFYVNQYKDIENFLFGLVYDVSALEKMEQPEVNFILLAFELLRKS